jgi:hypothetical protein
MLVQKIVVTIIYEHLLRITFTGASVPIYLLSTTCYNPFMAHMFPLQMEKKLLKYKIVRSFTMVEKGSNGAFRYFF